MLERPTDPVIAQLPPELAQLIQGSTKPGSYVFKTEDGQTSVALSTDAISLTTARYGRWEAFRSLLDPVLDGLEQIYKPSFFSRVGLRYRNTVDRETVGLQGRPWSALLNPEIMGELALPQFEENLTEARRVTRVNPPNGNSAFLLQHGLTDAEGTSAKSYLIDFDFYTDNRTGVSDAKNTLDGLHHLAGRGFRWCISEELHNSLHPNPL